MNVYECATNPCLSFFLYLISKYSPQNCFRTSSVCATDTVEKLRSFNCLWSNKTVILLSSSSYAVAVLRKSLSIMYVNWWHPMEVTLTF